MRILSLCDYTGNMVRPWADNGHECHCVDLQHDGVTHKDGITFYGVDIREFYTDGHFDLVFAFPPCTHLAGSGARWWKQKGLAALIDGLQLVQECLRIINDCRPSGWMLENPVGRLSTCWREPDATFDPCDYAGYLADPGADAYTKRTCLWTGGNFRMPVPHIVFPTLGSKMHVVPPGPNRQNIRSETPMGFATAVYRANCSIDPPLLFVEAK